jgi:hypothetical protein
MTTPLYLLSPHEQGTPGWYLDRAGRATGSMADAVCAQGRGSGEAVTRRNYRYQLACERLTGRPQESGFTNAHMERGKELEPLARALYEQTTGALVRTAGFAFWPTLPIGCSVDGFVGGSAMEAPAGFVEIKCPLPAIHIEYLEANRVPPAYVKQILHNLLVTGAAWCDFVSFNRDMPPELQLFVYRVERTAVALDIATYEAELRKFLGKVDHLTNHLRDLGARRLRG